MFNCEVVNHTDSNEVIMVNYELSPCKMRELTNENIKEVVEKYNISKDIIKEIKNN